MEALYYTGKIFAFIFALAVVLAAVVAFAALMVCLFVWSVAVVAGRALYRHWRYAG